MLAVLLLVSCQSAQQEATATPEPEVAAPTAEPTAAPTAEPTAEPTAVPAAEPTEAPMMAAALVANAWQWISFTNPMDQFEVEMPENYVVSFYDDGTFSMVADCNNVSGTYEDDAGSLSITMGPATLAACPGDSRGEQFVELLSGAARTFFEEGNLYIDLMADGGTMEFAPVPVPELTSTTWQWLSFTGNSGHYDVEMPESYLATFNEDGSLALVADCNNVLGDYTDEDGTLSISMGPATLAACPGDSRGEEFVQVLAGAERYFVEGVNLYVVVEQDGGTMVFAPAVATDASLTANAWQWTTFNGATEQFDVAMPQNYVLTFYDDGSMSIEADCNSVYADYTEEDGSLTITPGATTLAACPGDSRGEQFVELLGGAARAFFEEGNLYIDLMADGGTMVFAPVEVPTDLIANPWQWTAFNGATEQFEVTMPESYQLTFLDDGTAIVGADCNIAVGEYTTQDGSLTIALGPTTLAACAPESRSEQFINLVGGAARYAVAEGNLTIDLMADGGTMVFAPGVEEEPAAAVTAVDLCGEDALNLSELEATLAADTVSLLDDRLLSVVDGDASKPAPGVSLLVITPEGRYYKATGVANVATCDPLPPNALFEIGSNTKMMTAAVIYQLQEEGVLSTSDLMGEWVPEMAAIVPNSDQITIDMLLTHTAGIYDYLNGVAEDGPLAAGAEDKDVLTAGYTPEELVQLAVEAGEPYFEPGAEGQWQYSNTGYILLGMIIEAATGQTYEANLQARIFEPLGLENIFLLNGQPEPGLLPEGYLGTPFDYTTGEWNLSQGWSAGAVVADAEAMATFLKALFSGDLFQDPATVDLMLEPAAPGFEGFNDDFYYGHGMFYKLGLLGHGGQALGYQSDVAYLPDKDVTIVIWGNSAENDLSNGAVAVATTMGLIGE
jgi:D-alanyl-D-alanine carboxypeptidase